MEWMLLPYRRYFEFSGRSCRKEYWMFALFMLLVYVVLGVLIAAQMPWQAILDNRVSGALAFPDMMSRASVLISGGLLMLFGLGSLIPGIAVTVRRFHDQNQTGWLVLVFAVLEQVPYVGGILGIVQLVMMARKGTVGPNKYGADPLDPTYAGVFE
jgi:uncharacterized membrane protein YhaH (DUF805 family)